MSTAAKLIRTKRQEFAAPNGKHDRNVKLLRFILPVAVGILGSMLALAPFTMRGELSFVLDKNSVDVAKERMRVTEALYRGEDSEGRPFSLKAGSAVQKSSAEAVVELNDLSARILLTDGPAQIRARSGRYDMDEEMSGCPGRFRSRRRTDIGCLPVMSSLISRSAACAAKGWWKEGRISERSGRIGWRPIWLDAPSA